MVRGIVEEILTEYLAGVPQVEDITEVLRGSKLPPSPLVN